jgi:hypothetical protein
MDKAASVDDWRHGQRQLSTPGTVGMQSTFALVPAVFGSFACQLLKSI